MKDTRASALFSVSQLIHRPAGREGAIKYNHCAISKIRKRDGNVYLEFYKKFYVNIYLFIALYVLDTCIVVM